MQASAEAVTTHGTAVRSEAVRHPLGVISLILAGVAFVVVALSVGMVGTSAASFQSIYGRRLVEVPFAELPPSISVYVVVMGVAWLAWLVALVLGVVALLRFRCLVCGTLALGITAATPVLAVVLWGLTSSAGL